MKTQVFSSVDLLSSAIPCLLEGIHILVKEFGTIRPSVFLPLTQ